MEPIDLVVEGERWRVCWEPRDGRYVLYHVEHLGQPEEVWNVIAWAPMLRSLVEDVRHWLPRYRFGHPEAVEPLCRAIQERMSKGEARNEG